MMLEHRSPRRKLLAAIFAFLLALGGAYLAVKIADAPTEPPTSTPEEESNEEESDTELPPIEAPLGWLQRTEAGVRFSYPDTLPAMYLTAVDWPPAVQMLDEELECVEAGSATARAGRTDVVRVDGSTYCRTVIREGAAGSVYDSYAYAFERRNRTYIFTFSIRSVQCENYDEPSRTNCIDEQEAFNPDELANAMIRTAVIPQP